MAGTYYKYAEREANDQVNWFKVGKDLTDMLQKENETREAKKKAIDDASSQFGQELANAPQGNSDDVNRWTTNYAGDMQQYRLMTDKLLKSGNLKLKDYSLIRQNSLDGTKNLFNLSKEYQAEYDSKMKRRAEDISSASEPQFMAMVEGFANLGNTKALIDPPSGAISVGKLTTGPDGVKVLAEGNDNYMTVNQLRQRIKQNIDKYKLNDSLQGEVKLMGDVVNEAVTKTGSSTETGFLTKITDQTLRKGLAQEGQQAVDAYINLENKIVEAQLSNPQHTSSVLFDWAGGIDPKTNKPYQVTTDDKLAAKSSHYILWSHKDGIFQPDFESTANGKEQYKEAEKYVKTKLRGMLEQKTEMQPFQQPRKEYAPEYVYDRGDKKREEENALNLWQQLYSGATTGAKEAAKQGILGSPLAIKQGLIDIDVSDGKNIKLIYSDKSKNREFKVVGEGGETVSPTDWAAFGTEFHGVTDPKKYSKFSGQQFGTSGVEWDKISGGRAGVSNPNEMYANYVSSSIPKVPKNETEAVAALSPVLSKIGFTVEEAVPFSDYIVIKNKDGLASSEIQLSDPKAAETIQSFLLGNVPGEKEEDRIMYLSGLAKQGIFNVPKKDNPQPNAPKEIQKRIGQY